MIFSSRAFSLLHDYYAMEVKLIYRSEQRTCLPDSQLSYISFYKSIPTVYKHTSQT